MKEETKNIIYNAYWVILEDNKLIWLTTLTTFIHSIIITGYIIWQIYIFLNGANLNESFAIAGLFLQYIKSLTQSPGRITFLIIWGIIALIFYLLLPPIGYSSIIYRLSGKTSNSISSSIWKWVLKFFPMFEYFWMISLLSPFLIFITASRLYFMHILNQPLVITILIIWSLLSIGTSFFLAYTPFIIVLENKPVLTAIRESAQLAIMNVKTTAKFLILKYFLAVRFITNIILLLGVPMSIAYFAFKTWAQTNVIHNILLWLFALVFVLIAYINGIIEAFFLAYWYTIYKYIKWIVE